MGQVETQKFCSQINNMRKELKLRHNECNDKDDNREDILIRKVDFFRGLLEGEPGIVIDLEIWKEESVEAPTVDEVGMTIRKLKNNKSLGNGEIHLF